MTKLKDETIRKGCKDVFNAFLVKDESFDGIFDIPVCKSNCSEIPKNLIAYDLTKSSTQFNSYVHFYIDDQKFDGPRGIWNDPQKLLDRVKNFDGVITPDFSTNIDFPAPLKIYNTYKMRAIGCWLKRNGIKVINNVRWGDKSTYDYCFSGIPKHDIICIGTIGCIKEKKYWELYKSGLDEMMKRLEPKILLVYGNVPDKFFKEYKNTDVIIKHYPSQTSLAFGKKRDSV